MSLLFLSLLAALPADQAWFYPGPGGATARLQSGPAGDHMGGLPVERTGWLTARVADTGTLAALAARPEVAEVVPLRGDGRVVRIRPRAGLDEFALSRTLHETPGVVWSHPDFAVEAVATALPDDPFVVDQWHLANRGQRGGTSGVDINAELAWTRSTGRGGLIAILDSGVEKAHPDLRVTPGHDYVGRDDDPSPVIGSEGAPHGTACAGVAAATGGNRLGVAGVAYDSSIYAIRLVGGRTSLSDFYDSFVEAVDQGAWVLSNSWGYKDPCAKVPQLAVYDDAVAYAETMGRGGLGSIVVFAAGNGNCDIGGNGLLAVPEIVTVAASDGHDKREGYSCFGEPVDIAAPSGSILTTDLLGKEGYGAWRGDNNYDGSFAGTSAAAPVVSGVFALMFAANPRLTAAAARRVVCATAAKIDVESGKYDERGWSPFYGCGRIDAGAAVIAVANRAPAAPAIVAPQERAFVERVDLRWQPVRDDDADWLAYRVSWRVDGAKKDTVVDLPAGTTHLDLTRAVAAGQRIVFTVAAVDLWGAGAPSEPTLFDVVERPVPAPEPMPEPKESGCACRTTGAPTPPRGWMALLPALALLLRRRSTGRGRPDRSGHDEEARAVEPGRRGPGSGAG